MTTRKVSITPAQGVYGLFSAFDYTSWQALGEFVDNSVSSWWHFEDDYPLRIDITWDPDFGFGENSGRLVIRDNALGIALEDMDRAFELASPPEDLTKLNQFGVGMKVAACWFGRQWTVETSALGDPIKRTIHWDVDKIVADQIDELAIEEEPESPDLHYTILTISKLHHPPSHPQTIGKIKKYLPKLFRKFSEGYDVEIRWNGDLLTDRSPDVLEVPFYKTPDGPDVRWERSFEVEIKPGWKIDGYACVFEKFDRQHTGLNYFWRGRLIQGNIEPFHRPQTLFGNVNSFRTGRLYIELIADDLHVTSDKTSIDFGKSRIREEDLLEKVKKVLMTQEFPLIQQAENFRSNQPPPDLRPKVAATLNIVTNKVEEIGAAYLEEPIALETQPDFPLPSENTIDRISDRIIRHDIDGHQLEFRVCCVDSGPQNAWISIEWGHGSADEHLVYLNLAHPFIRRHLSADTLGVTIGFGVSMLYGEYKALSLVKKDELRVVRGFTDRFMRFMASYEEEIDDAREDSDL